VLSDLIAQDVAATAAALADLSASPLAGSPRTDPPLAGSPLSALTFPPEVFSDDIEGYEVRAATGVEYLVVAWRGSGTDIIHGVSLSRLAAGETVEVVQYDRLSPAPNRVLDEALTRALTLLNQPGRFEQGVAMLKDLVAVGAVQERAPFCPREELFEPRTADLRGEVEQWLLERAIPLQQWGRGEAKSLDHLVAELARGEAALSCENGEVYLQGRVVILNITWRAEDGGVFQLVEDRQEFHDGRIRRRTTLGSLPGEKLHEFESPEMAARRALREELVFPDSFLLERGESVRCLTSSQNYPGVIQRNNFIEFQGELPDRLMRPCYVEHGADKRVYFSWRELA